MASSSYPHTVELIFKDHCARKKAVLRALVHDAREFYNLCDPEKENLCLYARANGSWEVTIPPDDIPPEIPEPVLGINFARDGMNPKDWLNFVAKHSDSWLLAVAFHFGLHLSRDERERLFSLINDFPTTFEILTQPKPINDDPVTDSGGKSSGGTKRYSDGQVKNKEKIVDDEEDEEMHHVTLCGSCGRKYKVDEFWIACDICERWFHGKCVKITPVKAEKIEDYKCPSCSIRRRNIYHLQKLM